MQPRNRSEKGGAEVSPASLVAGHLRDLSPYVPGRAIAEIEREFGLDTVVKLASNENPVGMSPLAREAYVAAATEMHRYPEGGSPELQQALAEHHQVDPSRVLLGNGSNEVLTLLARLFLSPGDEVVVSEGAFAIYALSAKAQGADVVTVAAPAYTHDPIGMIDAVTERTKILYLCNPNNPTGTMFGRDVWEKFLASVPQDILVVCDNAYAEYVDHPDFPDAMLDRDRHPGLVVLRTFSKIYGMGGLRIGYGVGPDWLGDFYHRLRDPFNVNLAAEKAAVAALRDEAHVISSRRVNAEGRKFLRRAVKILGLAALPSETNFLTIEVGYGGDVADSLQRAGIIVRPLGGYGMPAHIRVSIGLPEENTAFAQTLAALLGFSGPGAPLLRQEETS
ncbi:MAG: histidinol-phosphate transaminase [Candidatus Binatia bacterium]|nr:histidinol-phosphate transaminase [Candidatus Binatia bacterium]MDG2011468.1 histidinol-phosphate transaminase [Candidatus Binatia bacterium]